MDSNEVVELFSEIVPQNIDIKNSSHGVNMEVYKGFDAMIYVYKATPIQILPREN